MLSKFKAGASTMASGAGEDQCRSDCIRECQVRHALSCFPGESTITVRGRGRVQMASLELGDMVLVVRRKLAPAAKGELGEWELRFEPVLAWLHRDPDAFEEMVEVQHSFGQVRMTPDHLLFGRRSHEPTGRPAAVGPMLAKDVKVGDRVLAGPWFDGNLVLPEVHSVRRTRMRGLFAPLVDSGTLLVSGTAASCYAIPGNVSVSPIWHHIMERTDGFAVQDAAHAVFLPLRLASYAGLAGLGAAECRRRSARLGEAEENEEDHEAHAEAPAPLLATSCAMEARKALMKVSEEAQASLMQVAVPGLHPYAWFCLVSISSWLT